MENILDFMVYHEQLFYILWGCLGLILYWVSVFIKQTFFWKKKGRVAIMFGGLEGKKDWIEAGILCLPCLYLGPLGFYLIYSSIKDVIFEKERLRIIASN